MEKQPFTVNIEWRIVNFASWTYKEFENTPICSSHTAGQPDIHMVIFPQGRCSDMEVRLYGDLGLYDCELSFFGNDGSLLYSQEEEGNEEDDFYQLFFGPEFQVLVDHIRKHEALYGNHLTIRIRFRAPGEEREEYLLEVVKSKEASSPKSSSESNGDGDSNRGSSADASLPPSSKKLKTNTPSNEPKQAARASKSQDSGRFLLRFKVCGNLCVSVTTEDFFASYPFAKDCFGRRPAVTVDTLKCVMKRLKKAISVNAQDSIWLTPLLGEYVEFITKFGTICADKFSLVGPFLRGKEDQIDYLVSVQRSFDERLRSKGKIRNVEIKYCWLIAQVYDEENDGYTYFYINASLLGRGYIFMMEHSGECSYFTRSFAEFLKTSCEAYEHRMMNCIWHPATKKRRVISSLDGLGEDVEFGRFQIESSDIPFSECR